MIIHKYNIKNDDDKKFMIENSKRNLIMVDSSDQSPDEDQRLDT